MNGIAFQNTLTQKQWALKYPLLGNIMDKWSTNNDAATETAESGFCSDAKNIVQEQKCLLFWISNVKND